MDLAQAHQILESDLQEVQEHGEKLEAEEGYCNRIDKYRLGPSCRCKNWYRVYHSDLGSKIPYKKPLEGLSRELETKQLYLPGSNTLIEPKYSYVYSSPCLLVYIYCKSVSSAVLQSIRSKNLGD